MKAFSLALGLMLALVSTHAAAQQWRSGVKRAGTWDMTLGGYATSSEGQSGANQSAFDLDSGIGLAFGIGYNVNEHLSLRFDSNWVEPDYVAILNTEDNGLVRADSKLSIYSGHFNGVYHLLEGAFTPYVQAGLGWTYLDSNIIDGRPSTGCWWDPLWGYICAEFYSTYSDTRFSWNVGLGLRYEFSRQMFIRGGWEQTNIDGGSGGDPTLDAIRFELGWRY
jgi:opacity protein-like surface antigen